MNSKSIDRDIAIELARTEARKRDFDAEGQEASVKEVAVLVVEFSSPQGSNALGGGYQVGIRASDGVPLFSRPTQ